MSSTGTRPPLFDPEPGSFDDDVDSPTFPRKRKRGKKGPTDRSDGEANTSPAWVRPFIFGGLILVAILSLFSFFGASDDAEEPADPAVAEIEASVVPAADGDAATAPAPVAQQPEAAREPAGQPVQAEPVSPQQAQIDEVAAVPAAPGAGTRAAEAFAVQFAHDYLNFDEANPQIRERKLRGYLASGLDPQLGWNGEGVQLAVLTLPVDVQPTDDGTVVVVAAQVTGREAPRWVHLAVPLAVDDGGRYAVTGQPSYVPRPPLGGVDPVDDPPVDQTLTAELGPQIERFFTAFGSETTVQLDGVTAPDSRIRGLNGAFVLAAVDDVAVHTGEDDQRTARATVTWRDDVTGTTVEQSYDLTFTRHDDGWLIEQLGP